MNSLHDLCNKSSRKIEPIPIVKFFLSSWVGCHHYLPYHHWCTSTLLIADLNFFWSTSTLSRIFFEYYWNTRVQVLHREYFWLYYTGIQEYNYFIANIFGYIILEQKYKYFVPKFYYWSTSTVPVLRCRVNCCRHTCFSTSTQRIILLLESTSYLVDCLQYKSHVRGFTKYFFKSVLESVQSWLPGTRKVVIGTQIQ